MLGATLIIAKLDRLARNVHFVSGLMESGVEFTAVEIPQANRLTVHILAAVAEHEARMISERTKAALAAAKARGVKLGGDRGARLTAEARHAGCRAVVERANGRAADLAPTLRELRRRAIAAFEPLQPSLTSAGSVPLGGPAHGRRGPSVSCCGGFRLDGQLVDSRAPFGDDSEIRPATSGVSPFTSTNAPAEWPPALLGYSVHPYDLWPGL